jgi:hypothetical protein
MRKNEIILLYLRKHLSIDRITLFFNKNELSKFKNLKSNDLQFLSGERNVRLLGLNNSNSFNHNFSPENSNFSSLEAINRKQQVGLYQNNLYTQSLLQ